MSIDDPIDPESLVADVIDAAEEIYDPLDGLVERTKTDPSAAFMPEVLDRLAALKKEDRAAFEALRSKLRSAGCRVTALDEAIAEENGDSGRRRPTQADMLIDLAQSAELFHAADTTGFADLDINGHRETWPIRSKGFRRWLVRRFFEATHGAPSSEALQSALNVIEARAHFDGPERTVHVRVAELEGHLYLDLGDETWGAVEIGTSGWRVIDNPPVRFRRAAGTQPLPIPVPGGPIEMLRPYLNVRSDTDFVLAVTWLLAALRDRGPYPVMVLSGEHGSAKSTFSGILRALVDPNTAPLRALPRENRDLFIAANNSHVLAFDNLSGLPWWISDTLCRLATGGGFAVRELYTDQDEVLFDATRPVILNGIEDIVDRPDLADRSLFVTLEPVPEERRRAERELWAAFELGRPRILGALLDAGVEGLNCLPKTRLPMLPRMADFALWGTACETAFWPSGTFWAAYCGNQDEAVEGVIDADPIAAAVRIMIAREIEWTGTATDLLGILTAGANDRVAKSKMWPDTPRALSGRLRRAANFLRKIGIEIDFGREGQARTRVIRITTTLAAAAVECAGARPSAPSASSAPAPNANPANVFAARDLQTVAVDADGRSKDADPTVRESASKPGRGDAADARSVAEGAAANPAVDRSVAVALDFETRNTGGCDLEDAGAWRYASDEATEVLTLTFQVDGGAHQLWMPAMGLCDPLSSLASDPSTSFVCFAGFELAVWQRIMVEQFGFAPVPIHRWIDVQAACSYFALPRSLGNVLQVIQAPVVKDEAGKRLVRSLSKPNERTGKYAEVTREILERVAAYNRIDVEGLIAVHTALGGLSERERAVWELDQQINQRGVGIDIEFVHAAKRIAETSTGPLLAEFDQLTGGLSPHQVDKTREWLAGRGFALEDLKETTVQDALDDLVVPPDVRRVLEIRLITGSTSLKKLDSMLDCVGADGRARGLLQYHAATTGRWSGCLLQPQNLPRPTLEVEDLEELVAAVKTGEPGALRRWGREPLEVLASALRCALVARDGTLLGVGDFSMIEACVLLALAGQHDKCALIAAGVDIYRDMAALIYGLNRDDFLAIPEAELTLDHSQRRRIGKNTVLGCGYHMGPERFRNQYLKHLSQGDGERLAKEIVLIRYRKNWAPEVPRLWRDLEQTARRAMLNPGVPAKAACSISYQLETIAGLPVLVCRLLNGKRIHYVDARVSSDRKDRFGNPVWTYCAYRKGQWRKIEPYGGQLTENAVQALARELLVDAMFRLEACGYPVVLTIHDEVVVEHPEITKQIMEEIMTKRPQWAEKIGVPIAVKAWVGSRYWK